jgi:hypothetical protein
MTGRMLARTVVAALCVGTAVGHLSAGEPETVVITLHAKAGASAQLEKVIVQHWDTARRLDLVQDTPHVTLRGTEKDDQVYFLEVFTWRDGNIPDHAPAEIQAIWSEMNRLVEPRGGRPGLEINQVSLVGR